MDDFRRVHGLILWVLVCCAPVRAGQFLLLDTVFTHLPQSTSQAYFPVPPGVPSDWRAPVDFAGGTVHFRLEVLEKPAAVGAAYQVCLEQDGRSAGKRACGKNLDFVDKGVFEGSQPLPEWSRADDLDWTRRPQEQLLILQDCFGVAVDAKTQDWVGSPYLTLYYPLRARFTAVVVSRGSAFGGWPSAVRKSGPRDARPILTRIGAAGHPSLEIRWESPVTPGTGMRILDGRGRPVFHAFPGAASRTVVWNGRDYRGGKAPAGRYFLEIREGGREPGAARSAGTPPAHSAAFAWFP
jgi:hypothetical protein